MPIAKPRISQRQATLRVVFPGAELLLSVGAGLSCVSPAASWAGLGEVVSEWEEVPGLRLYAVFTGPKANAHMKMRFDKRKRDFIITPKDKWQEEDQDNTSKKIRSSSGWRG